MYSLGTIVLVPFPFTDLSQTKVRPALIISQDNQNKNDVIICFITSQSQHFNSEDNKLPVVSIKGSNTTGLRSTSFVRLDKITTVAKKIILGKLGKVDQNFFKENGQRFFNIFGFEGL